MSERYFIEEEDEARAERDICILDENRLVVATLPWGEDDEGSASQIATARLLAASGRLRDALERVLPWAEGTHASGDVTPNGTTIPCDCDRCEATRKARDTLAEAGPDRK